LTSKVRQSRHTQIDAFAIERDALGLEQLALSRALGQRTVGTDNSMPRHLRVSACR
jgi:hypothetical protein